MSDGHIQQFATPEVVYDRPANLFVAGFIGSPPMNLIEGELSGDGDDVVFSAPMISIRLTRAQLGGIPSGSDRQVTLGIRPENITIDRTSRGDVTAKVGFVEFVGAEKYVFLESPVGLMIARESADASTSVEEAVNLVLPRTKIRLFSTASGKSLEYES